MQHDKARLRAAMRARRREFNATLAGGAGACILTRFRDIADQLGMRPGTAVGGYRPIGAEADVWPLVEHLHAQGAACLLPVVVAAGEPLVFRRWQPGLELEDGPLGTRQPGPGAEAGFPEIVLVPLLAFDRQGHRLGQGGGYYDRTLPLLRRRGRLRAVGIGLSCQEVPAVPHGPTDARLDWIVTEETTFRIEPS